MTHHLIMDYKANKRWNMEDLQYYAGIMSYYRMVEREYFDTMLDRYYKKYGVKVRRILKEWLGSNTKYKTRVEMEPVVELPFE